jgi:hypothetical protein
MTAASPSRGKDGILAPVLGLKIGAAVPVFVQEATNLGAAAQPDRLVRLPQQAQSPRHVPVEKHRKVCRAKRLRRGSSARRIQATIPITL